ncbi:MAG TPA: glycosyl hydrolase 53 family protein [Terriglobales bacterium]|jgi:arabinogalactan endo-1,4-beta-galactosidase
MTAMLKGSCKRNPALLLLAGGLIGSIACGGGSAGSAPPPSPTRSSATLTKAYAAASIPLNGTTTLAFHLANPNSATSLSGLGFSDNLPAGQLVATPISLSGNCGNGAISAIEGGDMVGLSGATLSGNSSCDFSIKVTGTASGTQMNTTSVVTSVEAGNGKAASATLVVAGPSQQPLQPTDVTPIDGEIYYVLNQFSGLQVDLVANSTSTGDPVVQQTRTFTNTSQRWTFTQVSGGFWQITNVRNRLCLEDSGGSVVQESCSGSAAQQWTLTPSASGYYTISNRSTSLLIDVPSAAGGAALIETAPGAATAQSQLWLLRPSFFRGVDNALLEKQEAARIATGQAWWKDGGAQRDVLQILKDHGVNLIRLRPTSAPPYSNPSQPGCSGDACFAETDAQDLDLARRAKNLGLSLELTLLFDGGHSSSVPAAWSGHSLDQIKTDIYNYVKGEIIAYRRAGAMPDLVSVGNEVDTGFLGSIGSPTGANFGPFAALQMRALQAVQDAAADISAGAAMPAPLTCIHITPAWDASDFFNLASSNGIQYDAICQSYYPLFHGPLTPAQASASNPNRQPVEQTVLNTAAANIGKPIFVIETGEHYENGFLSNDPWYPPSKANQAQFLRDLEAVLQNLPNHLAMGFAYWNPAGVDIPRIGGGLFNGGANQPDAVYVWNGLTIFDNADTSGSTNVTDPNYSTPLPALDALGGR